MFNKDEYRQKAKEYLSNLTGEEVIEMFTNAGFEVFEGNGEIINTSELEKMDEKISFTVPVPGKFSKKKTKYSYNKIDLSTLFFEDDHKEIA
ncbi:hypothetical protein [Peribacillus muralis]|uniref:hypothetical protein n=1 Tax=Peribacillus muralis TaxID=264697 RepID=UPI00366BAA67